MEYGSQQPIQQPAIPAAAAAPGWYPDPVTGAGERYWDGIAWSREYTRDAPSAAATVGTVATAAPATPREGAIPPGAIAMAIGVLLIVARIYYIKIHANDLYPDGTARNSGLAIGNIFGMFLGAAAFTHGFHRHTSAKESPTGEPTREKFGDVLPMTAGITIGGLLVAAVVSSF